MSGEQSPDIKDISAKQLSRRLTIFLERLALARTADDFFARVTSCVFSTDCDEEFKKLAIVGFE